MAEPLEAVPWGRKAQRTPPIPGSESKVVTCVVHFLAGSPIPKLFSDRRREGGNPLQASPQTSYHKLVSYDRKSGGLTFSSLQCLQLRSYFLAFLVVFYWTGLDLHTRCPGRNCSPHRRCTDCCSRKHRNQLFGLSSSLMKVFLVLTH